MCSPIEFNDIELMYYEKFNADVFYDMDIGEDVYVHKGKRYFFNSKKYDYERLMEQSLKEGRDLIYELCKDKPIPQSIFDVARNIRLHEQLCKEIERIKKSLPYYDEII